MSRVCLTAAFALSLLGSTTVAPAAMLGGDPGPVFDMPGAGDYYLWSLDLEGLSPGDTVLDFTVNVPVGGARLDVFQVFGADESNPPSHEYKADFALEVNQTPDTWTEVDYHDHWYHNYLEIDLEEGARTFNVVLTGSDDGAFPVGAGRYADVRFGNGPGIVPAVPLPAAALLLGGGILALAGLQRGRAGPPFRREKTE